MSKEKIQRLAYNTLMSEKVGKEYSQFIEDLKKKEPAEIIKASYEKVFKENMVACLHDLDISFTDADSLLCTENILDALYSEWLSHDEFVCMDTENLNICIKSCAEKFIVRNFQEKFKTLQWIGECDMSGDYEVMAVQIEFSHTKNEFDETELNVSAYDHKELGQIFADFCRENCFSDVEIKNVFIVRVAIDHETLTEMEERL